jgi:hypothetical protein
MFDTADNSLMVFMFGPVRSRPFTQSVHAFVGVGFVLGSVLVQPFLPTTNSGSASVCPGNGEAAGPGRQQCAGTASDLAGPPVVERMGGLPSICWPFAAIGLWCLLSAAGQFA